MHVEIATLSRHGGLSHNEDSVGYCRIGPWLACVVADGAGGHGGGDVASAIARDAVLRGFEAAPTLEADAVRSLAETANRRIVERQSEGGSLARMRSTLVLAAVDLDRARMVWVHSGDSRAYLFRNGTIVARTTDHSLVQQMVRGGMLGDEEARRHPRRSVLLSALGSNDGDVVIDVSDPLRLEEGDLLLLCSDGVWEPLGDALLSEAACSCVSPFHWIDRLEKAIAAIADPDQDNFSALVARVGGADDATRILS